MRVIREQTSGWKVRRVVKLGFNIDSNISVWTCYVIHGDQWEKVAELVTVSWQWWGPALVLEWLLQAMHWQPVWATSVGIGVAPQIFRLMTAWQCLIHLTSLEVRDGLDDIMAEEMTIITDLWGVKKIKWNSKILHTDFNMPIFHCAKVQFLSGVCIMNSLVCPLSSGDVHMEPYSKKVCDTGFYYRIKFNCVSVMETANSWTVILKTAPVNRSPQKTHFSGVYGNLKALLNIIPVLSIAKPANHRLRLCRNNSFVNENWDFNGQIQNSTHLSNIVLSLSSFCIQQFLFPMWN